MSVKKLILQNEPHFLALSCKSFHPDHRGSDVHNAPSPEDNEH